jgi:hypothetical protein
MGLKPHVFRKGKRAKRSTTSIPWDICHRCGRVLLRNAASQRAANAMCGGLEDET